MISKVRKVQAVIIDWAGTTIDYGCRAPLAVFLELFKHKGIPITIEEASKPMGKLKIEHIRELLSMERIKQQYIKVYKKEPTDEIVKQFNMEFEQSLFKILPNYTDPLPGVLDTIKKLRLSGLKIGSTTGYTKEMMDIIVPIVEKKGYKPDYLITSSEVKQGRPFPWMIYNNAMNLQVPMNHMIKVGDTIADIEEGKNADCWSIGVIEGSSLMGLTKEEFQNTGKESRNELKRDVEKKYIDNGADFVINSFVDLPEVIEKINEKLSRNFYPGNKLILPVQPYKIFTPGPISTSTSVKLTMMTDWGSREKDYLELVQNVRNELVNYATKLNRDAYTSIIMQGSGTFGVESCIGSAVPKGGKLLVIINGAYGKRMSKIAKILNIDTVELECSETEIPCVIKLEELLKNDNKITHVGCIHSETTTGIVNPIEKINKIIKKYNKISIIDAMSSFGAIPIDMNETNIDFMISSSNKNFEGVPGFSFIIAKKEELNKCKNNAPKSHSLDMWDQYNYFEKNNGGFRFTSPVHCIRAFDQALKELKQEGGIQERFKRYTHLNNVLIKGMEKMNFKTLNLKGYQGPIITTFHSPICKKYDFELFYEKLKDLGCVIYPGKLSITESFRIGTIGNLVVEDIEFLLSCIKQSIFWDNSL